MLAMAHPGGRPTLYTPELADDICAQLAAGLSLNRICKQDGMPSYFAIWSWLDRYPEFNTKYARAREVQAEYYADEIVDISDSADKDTAQAVRVRVDTRKWIAAKLRPKKYGELVKHEHGGADGAPIPVSITVSYDKPDGDTS